MYPLRSAFALTALATTLLVATASVCAEPGGPRCGAQVALSLLPAHHGDAPPVDGGLADVADDDEAQDDDDLLPVRAWRLPPPPAAPFYAERTSAPPMRRSPGDGVFRPPRGA